VPPTCPDNTVNFGPLAAEICWRVWGTPVNFSRFHVLVALLHGTLVLGVSKLCSVEQKAPPIFGTAAIMLGIGPHFSLQQCETRLKLPLQCKQPVGLCCINSCAFVPICLQFTMCSAIWVAAFSARLGGQLNSCHDLLVHQSSGLFNCNESFIERIQWCNWLSTTVQIFSELQPWSVFGKCTVTVAYCKCCIMRAWG